ncbi:PREDICTED: tigger transposable element-derived protein 1-like [Nanorana parkeri]|uniref:tigger transposable element-derived protein 1-like n=1 Tax=Nanorana parkeri TaxID=125878 RepID=UPI0008540BC2|nr:PREDICTED: tigger transposable element-derived protein 1-like [Nanorana parkeri]
MPPKKTTVTSENVPKKERRSITLEKKMEVVRRMEDGETRSNVCRIMKLPPSTVSTIIRNADKIKASIQHATPVSAAQTRYSRSKLLEKMEKLLSLWVHDLNKKNIPTTQAVITEKAKSIFEDLKKKEGGDETFLASKGWFMRFKSRTKCPSVKVTGEAASADAEAAAAFPAEFQAVVREGHYPSDLIFNVDETGLYWKKLPSRILIAQEEQSAPGFKPSKDRLTLLLGANVSGTLKLKPMLVYHSQTPRALKGLNKDMLPVYWKWNKKAWVTQEIFLDWYGNYFCPTVLRFCERNKLPPKALLLLGNAPGHPGNFDAVRTPLGVQIVYMPPNTTSLLQPMDQGVIATFKAYYLRQTFSEMVKVLDRSGITMKDYWRSFNVLKGVNNINGAWEEVTANCLNRVWRKLLPESAHDLSVEPLENIVEDVRRLAQEAGFSEMTTDDVTELLDSHEQQLSNEDLEDLAKELSKQNEEEKDEVADVPLQSMRTKDLQRILSVMETLADELSEMDPDWQRSATMRRGIMSSLGPYSEILRERKRQSRQSTRHAFSRKRQDSHPLL